MRTRLPQNAEDELANRILAEVRAVNVLIISDYECGERRADGARARSLRAAKSSRLLSSRNGRG